MKKFILGTKHEMTQVFTEADGAMAATVVSAGPVVVTQVKTKEKKRALLKKCIRIF